MAKAAFNSVTDDPGSKPDQINARRRDRQNQVWKNKETIRMRSERNPLCEPYSGTICWRRLQGYWYSVYDCVYYAVREGMPLVRVTTVSPP